ncbi:MAG: RibD family protein, partial [Planctomycetaceae bacterium]
MTLDGKLASRTGVSQWISCEASRAIVHELRGRMDAILVGSGTVLADDPRLTARPPGRRAATRIVLDCRGRIPTECLLTQTARELPVLVVTTDRSAPEWRHSLEQHGVELLVQPTEPGAEFRAGVEGHASVDPARLLRDLRTRGMTNLLVEGGAGVLGSFHDANLIDEFHCFIAPKLLGGAGAPSPIGGIGRESPQSPFEHVVVRQTGSDVYVQAWVPR